MAVCNTCFDTCRTSRQNAMNIIAAIGNNNIIITTIIINNNGITKNYDLPVYTTTAGSALKTDIYNLRA